MQSVYCTRPDGIAHKSLNRWSPGCPLQSAGSTVQLEYLHSKSCTQRLKNLMLVFHCTCPYITLQAWPAFLPLTDVTKLLGPSVIKAALPALMLLAE